ncbi:hypothetical protein ACIHEI_01345 [Kitasatospora sp. NPDC051984]|uniref:hypothetical protein n=1 Tax=Kitasatospora sp. NPDC051984 TaxID=3364059 RepID=UPI0037C7B042
MPLRSPNPPPGQLALTAGAAALALLLSTPLVARLLRPLLAPRLGLLLRRRSLSPEAGPPPARDR